jgi:hypothetical protein
MALDHGWKGIDAKGKWPDGTLRPITLTWNRYINCIVEPYCKEHTAGVIAGPIFKINKMALFSKI